MIPAMECLVLSVRLHSPLSPLMTLAAEMPRRMLPLRKKWLALLALTTPHTSCVHDCGSHQRTFPCTLVGAESAPDITFTHCVGDSRHTAANPQETTHDPRNGVSGDASVNALSIVTIVDSAVSTDSGEHTTVTNTNNCDIPHRYNLRPRRGGHRNGSGRPN